MSQAPNQTPDRLPVSTKLAYGLGTSLDMWGNWLFPSVAYAVFNMHLGLSPAYVGLALTLIRIYDAISDPLFGWISDNTRSRWGRRRPYILFAGIAIGLLLPCLFLVPPQFKDASFLGIPALFWFMISTHALYIPLVSAFNVPYQSLGNELTPDYHERTNVMAVKSGMQKLFEFGFYLALPFTNLAFFTLPDNGGQDVGRGILVYSMILGSIMVVGAITIFSKVKERYYETACKQERGSISESLYRTLKCEPFRWQLLMGLSFILGVSMVSSLGYYATVYYVCEGDKVAGNYWNGAMGVSYMIGGLLGVPFTYMIARLFSKRTAAFTIAGIGIAVFLGTWLLYNPTFPWLQLLASGGIAFISSGLWTVHGALGADVIDHDELATGKRREGAFTSSGSYIMKLGNSMGYYLAGLVLEHTGFNSEVSVQPESVIFAIRFFLMAIPVAGLAVTLFAIFRYSITHQRADAIRAELESRRGNV
jgi:GPH family glycoside/pentoside/hexuronide:cation symporter